MDRPSTGNNRAGSDGGANVQVCASCGRRVRQGLALAVRGHLFEVCEVCYIIGSINSLCAVLEADALEAAVQELRQVYQLLRTLETSRST